MTTTEGNWTTVNGTRYLVDPHGIVLAWVADDKVIRVGPPKPTDNLARVAAGALLTGLTHLTGWYPPLSRWLLGYACAAIYPPEKPPRD